MTDNLKQPMTLESLSAAVNKLAGNLDKLVVKIDRMAQVMLTKDALAGMATKADLAGMATKADLAGMATKADLAEGLTGLKDELNDRIDKLAIMTKEGFEELEVKMDRKMAERTELLEFRLGGRIDAVHRALQEHIIMFPEH